jgi:hypothetical protein
LLERPEAQGQLPSCYELLRRSMEHSPFIYSGTCLPSRFLALQKQDVLDAFNVNNANVSRSSFYGRVNSIRAPAMDTAEKTGALPAPPGITPNFHNPENRAYQVIIVSVIWPVIALTFLLLRLYTKRYIIGKLHLDDCESCSAQFEFPKLTRQIQLHSHGYAPPFR